MKNLRGMQAYDEPTGTRAAIMMSLRHTTTLMAPTARKRVSTKHQVSKIATSTIPHMSTVVENRFLPQKRGKKVWALSASTMTVRMPTVFKADRCRMKVVMHCSDFPQDPNQPPAQKGGGGH